MHDWAVRPVKPGCYSWVALSLIDSKTLYKVYIIKPVIKPSLMKTIKGKFDLS